jgi:polar amino acid transport system substrate-binding protein
MKQVTLNYKSGQLRLSEVPSPTAQPGCLLVRTAFSAISLGTEGMKVTRASKGIIAMARERPDQVKQVIDTFRREGFSATYEKVMNRLDAPTPLGYSASGVVLAVGEGVRGFAVGDHVACAGEGVAVHADVVSVPQNLCARVPKGVSLEHAAFTTVGAIAIQGVRQSSAGLGEFVVVIGLGLIGQLAIQLYRAAGCRVFGIDLDDEKCGMAERTGAERTSNRGDVHLSEHVLEFTNGRLADVVLVTAATPSSDPVRLAVELCRDRGTVVVLGIVGMELAFEKLVKKEVTIKMSRSYGPGRYDPTYENKGVDYPIGYVRWTEQRNMESFLQLISSRTVSLEPIITHRFKFAEVEEAYNRVLQRNEGQVMGILLEYECEQEANSLGVAQEPRQRATNAPKEAVIGILGAGNFLRGTLLPMLKSQDGVRFRTVVNATGLSAKHVADRFGFEIASTDHQAVFNDTEITCIVVGTPHDSHARYAIEALRHEKIVFVEKPLALTADEMIAVTKTVQQTGGRLMVGFNRRFAPATLELKSFFKTRSQPLVLNYRINAGFLTPQHWLQDPAVGGGRILGEACHFIDWMYSVVGHPIVAVSAFAADDRGIYCGDNLVAQFRFADGSIGTMTYVANGDNGLGKEYIEVFGERSAILIDNYESITTSVRGKTKKLRSGKQDKGHAAEIKAFISAVMQGTDLPISFAEIEHVTWATLAVLDSARRGATVMLEHG